MLLCTPAACVPLPLLCLCLHLVSCVWCLKEGVFIGQLIPQTLSVSEWMDQLCETLSHETPLLSSQSILAGLSSCADGMHCRACFAQAQRHLLDLVMLAPKDHWPLVRELKKLSLQEAVGRSMLHDSMPDASHCLLTCVPPVWRACLPPARGLALR